MDLLSLCHRASFGPHATGIKAKWMINSLTDHGVDIRGRGYKAMSGNCWRLCKPHAISITPAAMPLVVKRNTSLTIRHRLIPAITCSTTTRTLEKIRLQNFSPTVSSLPWGFFWAAWSTRLPAHSLESRYLCLAWCWYGRQLASRPPPSCHASCPATLVLDRQLCPCVR